MNDGDRVTRAGGFVDIGPECFGLRDGSMVCWKGDVYVPQKTTLRVWLHNMWVAFVNRRR